MARKQDTTQLDLFVDIVLSQATVPQTHTRKPMSEAARQKIREHRLGKKWSDEIKEKFRQSHLGLMTGEKNHNWKGGEVELLCKTCEQPFSVERYRLGQAKYCSRTCRKNDPDKKSLLHKRIRASVEYRVWREAVFLRDDYTCQLCGVRGTELNADHIKPFALYPELRFDVDNGRTLCRPCHLTTETFGVSHHRMDRDEKGRFVSKSANN